MSGQHIYGRSFGECSRLPDGKRAFCGPLSDYGVRDLSPVFPCELDTGKTDRRSKRNRPNIARSDKIDRQSKRFDARSDRRQPGAKVFNVMRRFFNLVFFKQPVEKEVDRINVIIGGALQRVKIASDERRELVREVLEQRERSRNE